MSPRKPPKPAADEQVPPAQIELRDGTLKSWDLADPPQADVAAKVQTVKVAKSLVSMAKKVAVLRGVKQEDYIAPTLIRCIESIQEEIEKSSSRGVRFRAEAPENMPAGEPQS